MLSHIYYFYAQQSIKLKVAGSVEQQDKKAASPPVPRPRKALAVVPERQQNYEPRRHDAAGPGNAQLARRVRQQLEESDTRSVRKPA